MINEDSINLISFQLSTYGGYQVIRLDFNPNSLKEFWRSSSMEADYELRPIKWIRCQGYHVQTLPLISLTDQKQSFYNISKGGVSHKIFYGRERRKHILESKYQGASGSNIQVRLYDKNIEVLSHKRADKLNIEINLGGG